MSNFFTFFPTVMYPVSSSEQVLLTNVSRRAVLREKLKLRTVLFFPYSLRDGDRPDVVAHKVYNNSNLDWLVLLTNQIIDPRFDWVKGYSDFEAFLVSKYGSVEQTHRTTHEYHKIVQVSRELPGGGETPERYVVVDETTYNNTPDDYRRRISKYDYENNLNESRRSIQLIKIEFIPQILREMDVLLR